MIGASKIENKSTVDNHRMVEMVGIILASLLTLLTSKSDSNKLLASLLVLYICFHRLIEYTGILTFTDYLIVYSISSGMFCIVFIYSIKGGWTRKISAISVITPQLYYIAILYKPYLLSVYIPMWFLINVDMIFTYGVFALVYEHNTNYRDLSVKEGMVHVGIVLSLIVF